jgi:hypothetical protein
MNSLAARTSSATHQHFRWYMAADLRSASMIARHRTTIVSPGFPHAVIGRRQYTFKVANAGFGTSNATKRGNQLCCESVALCGFRGPKRRRCTVAGHGSNIRPNSPDWLSPTSADGFGSGQRSEAIWLQRACRQFWSMHGTSSTSGSRLQIRGRMGSKRLSAVILFSSLNMRRRHAVVHVLRSCMEFHGVGF